MISLTSDGFKEGRSTKITIGFFHVGHHRRITQINARLSTIIAGAMLCEDSSS